MVEEIPPLETPAANRLATGAPGTVTFGDKLYLVAQPTDADMTTIFKHLAEKWKKRHGDPLGAIVEKLKGLPPNVQEVAIREAVRLNNGNAEPDNAALTPMLLEEEGVAFAYWLFINRAGNPIDLATVQAAITEQNVNDYVARLLRIISLKDVAPN